MVINEVSVNDPEFVELLVTTTGDYQNYAVTDGFTAGSAGAGGFQFTGAGFQNLEAGTIIVVWAESTAPGVEDLTYNPGGGDFVLQFTQASLDTGTFAIEVDTGMILGATGEVVVVGQGGPFVAPFVADGSDPIGYYDPLYFKSGIAADQSPQNGYSASDVDLATPLNCQAIGSTFAAPSDYDTGILSFTPGAPNTPDNNTYILGLQGVAPDDPDIFVASTLTTFPFTDSANTNNQDIVIQNAGSGSNLNVASSTLTGGTPGVFNIVSEPTGVAPSTTATLTVQFNPAGQKGYFTTDLTVVSDDSSGDQPVVTLQAVSGDPSDFDGLYISEVITDPAEDECVELHNTSASPMDISGLIISDEDTSATEGAIAFPAATTIGADEVIIVAVNTNSAEPGWLDSLPVGVRVFHEPSRDASLWTAANGNTITSMDDYDLSVGGTSGTVTLTGSDNLALHFPGTFFISAVGAFDLTSTIDGLNWDDESTGPVGPINGDGDIDTQATRAGSGFPTTSVQRMPEDPANYTKNTASNLSFFYTIDSEAVTPGLNEASSLSSWELLD